MVSILIKLIILVVQRDEVLRSEKQRDIVLTDVGTKVSSELWNGWDGARVCRLKEVIKIMHPEIDTNRAPSVFHGNYWEIDSEIAQYFDSEETKDKFIEFL